MDEIVKMVFSEELYPSYLQIDLLEQEIYKLFVNNCKNIKELRWQTSQPLPLFPGASTCFSQLYELDIYVNYVNSTALYEMAQICKDLNELIIHKFYQDIPGLTSLINAQRNLKRVVICALEYREGPCKELGNALARKGNTLSYLNLN